MLKGLGIVEARHGSGVFVGRMDFASVFEMLSPLLRTQAETEKPHMMEVRLYLEPTMAELAARRRNEENVAVLEKRLADMERNLLDLAVFIQHDMAFHQELALATGNPIFQVFSASLTDLMREVQFAYPQHARHRRASVEFHARILEAVQNQDADAARVAMAEHMAYVGDHI
jgi:DNA-binding FadR family transcriptional regulator